MLTVQKPRLFREIVRDSKLSFVGISDLYIFSFFVLPTYFGVRLGFFDMTSTRLLLIFVFLGIWKNKKRRYDFLKLCNLRKQTVFIYLFWFVMLYTNLLRKSVNGVFLTCIDIFLSTIIILYLITYVYGVEGFLDKIKIYAWILGICGVIEGVLGVSPFSVLNTLSKGGETTARFGTIRICGPCTISNGYGLYLLILIPLVCINYKKNTVDILKSKWLVLILLINVFLTGARLILGIAILELLLLIVLSNPIKLPRVLLFFGTLGIGVVLFLTIFPNLEISRTIMRSVLQVLDVVMGTTYADAFGSDSASLYNSSYYRTLLLHIFSLDYLNPWLGRGSSYHFSYAMEGYWIQSIDNYYVGLYVLYGYPGLITFLLMSVKMFFDVIKAHLICRRALLTVAAIIMICYYLGLWYLDQLQTYKFIYVVFMLVICEINNIKKGKIFAS